MIKFKEFDVGDIDYEEQMEQFQKEHPSAEFVQITGGHTTHEKIWFKYDEGIEQSELNENQQIVLDWLKTLPLFPISAVYLLEVGKNVPNNVKNAYENFDKKEEAEVLQAFSLWAFEQEEK